MIYVVGNHDNGNFMMFHFILKKFWGAYMDEMADTETDRQY